MDKVIDDSFDFGLDGRSVFQLVPKVFNDERGWFAEMLRAEHNVIDIKQINRSCSKPGVIRGCHAQRSPFCQAKLVEAVNTDLIDVITDARPVSTTFGKSKMYLLSAAKQNKLYVPKGFLHAFIVPCASQKTAYFNYYCDNVYDKASEVCVNPVDVIQPLVDQIDWKDVVQAAQFGILREDDDLYFDSRASYCSDSELDIKHTFSIAQRDLDGKPLDEFLSEVRKQFNETGKLWYA